MLRMLLLLVLLAIVARMLLQGTLVIPAWVVLIALVVGAILLLRGFATIGTRRLRRRVVRRVWRLR